MKPEALLETMRVINQLKDTTRHSWTKLGRHESVAEHTYSICMLAYLCQDEFSDVDMNKVIQMCLFHDIGEAFTGDIPAFEKEAHHEDTEQACIDHWLTTLPESLRNSLQALFTEMNALETKEAKVYKALDKMDALIMHNEADISTWLPLEYELNLTYGEAQVAFSPYMKALKQACNEATREKIAQEMEKQEKMQID